MSFFSENKQTASELVHSKHNTWCEGNGVTINWWLALRWVTVYEQVNNRSM